MNNNIYDEWKCCQDFKNICSWLLIFTPEELNIFTCILSLIISKPLTIEEKVVVGGFLTSLADNILLIAAQEELINAALEEQKQIDEQLKDIMEKQKEKDKTENEIKDIKEKLNKIEELLNKQLKI